MKNKQYKSLSYQIKDMDTSKREVSFYFNRFNEPDSENDIFLMGSSTKTVRENFSRIKHLYNHWDTVGKPLKIEEDETGTFMVSKIGRDSHSNDVLLKYEDGLITEHSFGFRPVKHDKNNIGGMTYSEYELWEASSLDKWGAQSQTPVISLKSLDKANVQEWVTRLERLTKALKRGYTDEQAQDFEIQIKKITEFLKSMTDTTQPEQHATTEPGEIDEETLIKLSTNFKLFS